MQHSSHQGDGGHPQHSSLANAAKAEEDAARHAAFGESPSCTEQVMVMAMAGEKAMENVLHSFTAIGAESKASNLGRSQKGYLPQAAHLPLPLAGAALGTIGSGLLGPMLDRSSIDPGAVASKEVQVAAVRAIQRFYRYRVNMSRQIDRANLAERLNLELNLIHGLRRKRPGT
eukprot:7385277-Prymnesium_polylepis.1